MVRRETSREREVLCVIEKLMGTPSLDPVVLAALRGCRDVLDAFFQVSPQVEISSVPCAKAQVGRDAVDSSIGALEVNKLKVVELYNTVCREVKGKDHSRSEVKEILEKKLRDCGFDLCFVGNFAFVVVGEKDTLDGKDKVVLVLPMPGAIRHEVKMVIRGGSPNGATWDQVDGIVSGCCTLPYPSRLWSKDPMGVHSACMDGLIEKGGGYVLRWINNELT